jgi:hypothetical protein
MLVELVGRLEPKTFKSAVHQVRMHVAFARSPRAMLRRAAQALKICLMIVLTLPVGLGQSAAQAKFITVSETPKGFEALTEPQTTLLDVYYANRQIASTMATFSAESVVFNNPIEVLSKIPRLKNQGKLLGVLSGSLEPNVELVCFEGAKPESPCGKLKPETIGVILDEGNFRVDIFVHPDFLDIHELGLPRYLPPSEAGLSIVSSFAGAVSGSASTSNTHNTRNQTVIGLNQSRVRVDSSYSNTAEWFFDTAFMERDIREQRFMAGVFHTTSMDNIGEQKLFGLGYTTTTDTRVDLEIGFGNQLVVFLPQPAQVDIFKDDRLIGSRFYEAGKQIIDTGQLPEGAYDVVLKIKERSGATREETHFYTKATNLPPSDSPLIYVEGGMLLTDVNSPFPMRTNIPILHYGAMFRYNDNWGLGADFITSDTVSVGEFRSIYLGRNLRFRGAAVLTSDDDIAASMTASGDMWDVGYTVALRRNWAGGALTRTTDTPVFDPIGSSFTQARASLSYVWGQAQDSWSSLYQANEGQADTYSHGPTFTYPLYRDAKWSAILRMEAAQTQDQTSAMARLQFRMIDPNWSVGATSSIENIDSHAAASGSSNEGYSGDASVNGSWQDQDLIPGDLTLGGTFAQETGLRTMQTNASHLSKWGRYSMDVDRSWGRNSSGDGASVAGNFATSLISDGSTIVLGGRERRDSGVVVTLKGRAKDAVFNVVVDGLPSGEIKVGESLPLLLQPYKTYGVRIEPVGGDFVSYESDDKEITLYPGNVTGVVWSINPIVAVFGRVVRADGTPVAFARIGGVAGGAFTDEMGYFQTEMTDPGELTFTPGHGSVCSVFIKSLPETEVFSDVKEVICRDTLLEAKADPAEGGAETQVAAADEEKGPDWSKVITAYRKDLGLEDEPAAVKDIAAPAPEPQPQPVTVAEATPEPAPVVAEQKPEPATPDIPPQPTPGSVLAATEKLEKQVDDLDALVTAAEREAQVQLARVPVPAAPEVPAATPVVEPEVPATPAVPAVTAASTSTYRVQLAAYRQLDNVKSGWQQISRRAGPTLAGHSGVVLRADLGKRGTFYRLQAGPATDRVVARDLCDQLIGKSISCRLVRLPVSALATPGDECVLDQGDGVVASSRTCEFSPQLIAAVSTAKAKPAGPAVTPVVRPGQTVGAASGVSFDRKVISTVYRIQLGSHRKRQLAEQDWQRLVKLSEGFLAGLDPVIARADLGSRGIYHRLQIEADSRKDATALCRDLKDLALPCLVVKRPESS